MTKNSLFKVVETDVAIVGGGLAGISTAYFLAKSGKQIIVVEANEVGGGATARTTAFITQSIDTPLSDLVSMIGTRGAKLVWESGGKAIDTIEAITHDEHIDCGFMRASVYVYANSKSDIKSIGQEYRSMDRLGFNGKLHPKTILPFPNFGSVEIKDQAKFDAGAYIKGLAAAVKKQGGKIFENAEVKKIEKTDDFWILTTKNIVIKAKDIVITTYYPYGSQKPTRFKKGMYKSYVFEVKVPKGSFREALYWDMMTPYHYFRIDRGDKNFDTIIIGGEDHRDEIKMDTRKNFRALEMYLKNIMDGRPYSITKRWTGPILEPSDGLALIGKSGLHAYVATAFSGNGMTYSTIAGLLISDLIQGRKNAWASLYDPKRKMPIKSLLKKGIDYSQELLGGAVKNSLGL